MTSRDATIQVKSLSVDYWDRREWVNVVNRVSFDIRPGETLGLAGETGCGKTTTGYALFGYRRPGSRFREGEVIFEGKDLLRLEDREKRPIRGKKISLVPQNPAGALTPSMRVGHQVIESMGAHGETSGREAARERTVQLLSEVGLPEPEVIVKRYPHQLSGGQQQRVIIAMALACNPHLVVLDEPTSALDVTIQARILTLLMRLQAKHGMSMLFITHDFGVLAQISERVAVMYAGDLVEVAPTTELFLNPQHPYTRGLIAAVPQLSEKTTGRGQLRGLFLRDELPEEGCRFAPRCHYAQDECFTKHQSLTSIANDHQVACRQWRIVKQAISAE